MKLAITILLITIFILLLTNMTIFSRENRTEQQPYQVIKQLDHIEIRYYPEAVLATVYSNARNYRELSGPGFNTLAGYIFGGNQENEKIAMTAPVHMSLGSKRSSMSFVMPSKYKLEDLPKPGNPYVQLGSSPAEYVAVIRFGGWANDQKIQEYSQMLAKSLAENKISHKENFRYLGYNPPYQFAGRRNEIVVTINWQD
jgi:hypothetical protein